MLAKRIPYSEKEIFNQICLYKIFEVNLKRAILMNDKSYIKKVSLINSEWFEKWKKLSYYEAIKDELNMNQSIQENYNNSIKNYYNIIQNFDIQENLPPEINNNSVYSGYNDNTGKIEIDPYFNFELISPELWNSFVPPNSINDGTGIDLDIEYLTKDSLIVDLSSKSCYIFFWKMHEQKLGKIILIFPDEINKFQTLEYMKAISINNFYGCFLSELKDELEVNESNFSFKCINRSENKGNKINGFEKLKNKNNEFFQEYITKIKDYENKLKEQININKTQKDLILRLQNELNNANYINNLNQNFIKDLQTKIYQKESEIKILKKEKEENNSKMNNQNRFININNLMSANFISTDGTLHYSIPCESSDIFAEIEEKLYKKYPEYRETNNLFLYKGQSVLRFKTLAENKIENGMPITLNKI